MPFDFSKETVFIIHGWMASAQDEMPQIVKNAYLRSGKAGNIVVVDWSAISSGGYVTARYFIPQVGTVIGNFLQFMVTKFNLNIKNTGLVGHSLGAHICGVVGLTVKTSVDHIVGE